MMIIQSICASSQGGRGIRTQQNISRARLLRCWWRHKRETLPRILMRRRARQGSKEHIELMPHSISLSKSKKIGC
ncbi:hypothetical protein HBI68_247130 [Parastagonospora nodorum]|nr:hypothetical protein HBI68_247130 [Parastagonospora nodorum]